MLIIKNNLGLLYLSITEPIGDCVTNAKMLYPKNVIILISTLSGYSFANKRYAHRPSTAKCIIESNNNFKYTDLNGKSFTFTLLSLLSFNYIISNIFFLSRICENIFYFSKNSKILLQTSSS